MNRDLIFLKSTLFNYIFRIIAIIISFFTIPITLNYLGEERFGVWQTMLSIISWASIANFGVGNGLRNIISEQIILSENKKLKNNISSAYKFISYISILILIILSILILAIKPEVIFKNLSIDDLEIKISFFIIALNFCINFILGIVNSIAFGIHKSHYVTIQQTVVSLITLILIFLLNMYTNSNLINIAILYTLVNTLGNIVFSKIIFSKNIYLKPILNYDKTDIDERMYKLGIQFFIVQLGSLILASTDNFLVSSFIGVEQVTNYSIINKFFITINTLYGILLIPLWNATTDAITRNDIKWIIQTIKKLLLLLIIISIPIYISTISFDLITKVWIGRILDIDKLVINFTAIYVLLLCFNSIFINIQNGMGKIKFQIIAVSIAALINIPLAYFFVNYLDLELSGIVLANIISQLVIAIICPINIIVELKKKREEILT